MPGILFLRRFPRDEHVRDSSLAALTVGSVIENEALILWAGLTVISRVFRFAETFQLKIR